MKQAGNMEHFMFFCCLGSEVKEIPVNFGIWLGRNKCAQIILDSNHLEDQDTLEDNNKMYLKGIFFFCKCELIPWWYFEASDCNTTVFPSNVHNVDILCLHVIFIKLFEYTYIRIVSQRMHGSGYK